MEYMRIAIFTDTYKPQTDGIITSIIQFSGILADEGHEIMIFCPKYKKNDVDPKHKNITIKRYYSVSFVNYKHARVALPSLITMLKDLRKFKPDVVHVQTPLIIGIVSLFAAKILRLKNIQTYHSYIPDFMVYVKPKTLPGMQKFIGQVRGNGSIGSIKKALRSEIVEDKGSKFIGFKLVDKIGDLSEEVSKGDQKMADKIAWELTRKVYNRANLVLTPTNALKKEIEKHGVKKRIEVLSNGIDLDYFKKKNDYVPRKNLIHVGRIGFEKNVEVVIKAISIAAKDMPGIKLDIVGTGPAEKKLNEIVNALGVKKNVRFLGFIPREKLKDLYCKYDAFITASTMETQGLVILEAMSAGLPAIGVDKLAVPDMIKHEVNGYISKPYNEKEMAKNILKLYRDPSRLQSFGEQSLELAKKHDVKKCAEKLLEYYKEYAKRRTHARAKAVKVK